MNEQVTVNELPEPSALTSEQRLAIVQKFRAKIAAGDRLTPDEARYAISALRTERSVAAASRPAKAAKAVTPAVSLEDF